MAQITCSKCGQVAEQMASQPMGGKLGEAVWARVCGACWQDWLTTSMRLVNHYGLQPANPEDRKQIYAFMREYLNLGGE